MTGSTASRPSTGIIGIGPYRLGHPWPPQRGRTAHPHATDDLAIVHNGIIENFRILRHELEDAGVRFESATDTEVVARLVSYEIGGGLDPAAAVKKVLPRLRGAFALAFLFRARGSDDRRPQGLTFAIHGEGEMFLGSDALALAPFTETITYLEEGDIAVLTQTSLQVFTEEGEPVERPASRSPPAPSWPRKGNLPPFHGQGDPRAAGSGRRTLAAYTDMASGLSRLPDGVGCRLEGAFVAIPSPPAATAYYAGLVAKYWFERFARNPVEIDVASEFRYRDAPLDENGADDR